MEYVINTFLEGPCTWLYDRQKGDKVCIKAFVLVYESCVEKLNNWQLTVKMSQIWNGIISNESIIDEA